MHTYVHAYMRTYAETRAIRMLHFKVRTEGDLLQELEAQSTLSPMTSPIGYTDSRSACSKRRRPRRPSQSWWALVEK